MALYGVSLTHVAPLLTGQEDLALSGEVSKEAIDFLSCQISRIESVVLGKIKLRKSFQCLLSIPGVGRILSLIIMLETGTISRFAKVGDFTSYCRKVPTSWTSNNKKKGKGNTKNGNKYLAWAFSEAAEYARRNIVTMPDHFLTVRQQRRIKQWPTVLWHTSWQGPPITS